MGESASIANAVIIILAAGLSTRMGGRMKPGLIWVDGRTLLEHQEEIVRQAGFESLAVTAVARSEGRTAINPHPERGLAESLKCGVSAVRRQHGKIPIGILLVDQPFVARDDITSVYEGFKARPVSVHGVRARYEGAPGHPVFFDAGWDEAVLALTGDAGLGKLWSTRPDADWVDIEVANRPNPSFDIDTETAYQQALRWAH